ncbi:TPA: diguanylate cyclase response regulator [Candidatus Sumerlaeota bacterium]|jgi:two-component system, cell cycle response regulator|nr:diguanylate cyclase response regulator [Candidatus Sumerlaeota bacterium]
MSTMYESPLKVLVAEDDSVARRLLESILEKWGFEVVGTNNGLQAWEAMQQPEPPEIAILDWVMPEMEGPEVCKKIRDLGMTTYVILLTARDSKQDVVSGLESGADDYMPKPFNPQELRARVRVGTRIVKLQRALSERIGQLEVFNQRLEVLSLEDKLTCIPNRRALDEAMEREWRRCLRSNVPLAVIMIDIDSFKNFNDNYGHQAGDECLRQIAKALRSCTHRASDFLGRYGGEEFMVLLPGVDRDGASIVANHLRSVVQALGIKHDSCRSNIGICTISLGVSLEVPSANSSIEEMIARADAALYKAKELNGNQTILIDASAEDEQ